MTSSSNPSFASPCKTISSTSCRLCGYNDDPTSNPPSSGLVHVSALYSALQEEGRRKEIAYKKQIMELVIEKDEVEAKNLTLSQTVDFLQSEKGKKGLEAIDEWKALVRSLQEDRERLRREVEKRENGGEIAKNRQHSGDWVATTEEGNLRERVKALELELELCKERTRTAGAAATTMAEDENTVAPQSMSAMMREDPPLDSKISNDRTKMTVGGEGGVLTSILRSVRGVIVGVIVGFRIITAPSTLHGKKTDEPSEGDDPDLGDFCTEGAVII
ncbi:hypothetical protein TrRE_jg9499 [Triparma retinervis]|uniref:Uncharacterized protein n=1 Tax=Triparma retinervis TaxID=2557542 RepID=A0A9W7AID6_9STRA|nr:hypothetical protein TrRE_jg9499 [Triparma retinervis]